MKLDPDRVRNMANRRVAALEKEASRKRKREVIDVPPTRVVLPSDEMARPVELPLMAESPRSADVPCPSDVIHLDVGPEDLVPPTSEEVPPTSEEVPPTSEAGPSDDLLLPTPTQPPTVDGGEDIPSAGPDVPSERDTRDLRKGNVLTDPLLAKELMLANVPESDWHDLSAQSSESITGHLYQSLSKAILAAARLEEIRSEEGRKVRRERDLAYAGKGACKAKEATIKSLQEELRAKTKEGSETAVALERQKVKRRLLKVALQEEKQRVLDSVVQALSANARAESAVKRAEDAVARASQAEAEAEACAEAASKACEEKIQAAEEQIRAVEEKTRVVEEMSRSAEERARAAEEMSRAAEERARAAEERIRVAEERIQAAEETSRTAEEKARAAEEEAGQAVLKFKSSQAFEDELTLAGSYSYGLGSHDMFNKIQLHFPKIDFKALKPRYDEAAQYAGVEMEISSSSDSDGGAEAEEAGVSGVVPEESMGKNPPAEKDPAEEAAAETSPPKRASSEEIQTWTP